MLLMISMALSNDIPTPTTPTIKEVSASELPYRYAYWCKPPVVRVCKDSKLDLDLVRESLDFFNQPIDKIKSGQCTCAIKEGEIQVGVQHCGDLIPEKKRVIHGRTITSWRGSCIDGSVVLILTNESLVVTHEVGHALGWGHSSFFKHIMYSEYEGAGWFKFGME